MHFSVKHRTYMMGWDRKTSKSLCTAASNADGASCLIAVKVAHAQLISNSAEGKSSLCWRDSWTYSYHALPLTL